MASEKKRPSLTDSAESVPETKKLLTAISTPSMNGNGTDRSNSQPATLLFRSQAFSIPQPTTVLASSQVLSIQRPSPSAGHYYMIRDSVTRRVIAIREGILIVLPESEIRRDFRKVTSHWLCYERSRVLCFKSTITGCYIDIKKSNASLFPLKAAKEVPLQMTGTGYYSYFTIRVQDAREGTYSLLMWISNGLWPVKISSSNHEQLVVCSQDYSGTMWEFIPV
ncbi:uncharacterized protein TRUGW13939_11758 [Talaromyces rugulosus]|uniref:Uncharacterized protein n=1 Tax=Talaromyces rugulosus TaxID=121627 RepID=A0A7H8RIX2_TALRU|nr:uncharacterized protein TRUGW13939_11758 [Talaromyces rugulosus]QKX64583.1 hypothetical protein TRUGW13939_11758 [Talaromyces rugulosus]